ncbi:hypothetical protein [Aequorivita sediminis]|uniref:hypothetical protein n=1 Tax=Aequorivita sediminis TaxID=3073653 RepID=UPI0028AD0FB0|nr:hypothetical protein [Aequorivita sp. F6058]
MNLSKLINKGLITVYGSLVSFVIICGFIANWFTSNILKLEKADYIVAITVFLVICFGWIWWNFKIVKWKYWAFSKLTIDESYELYIKAIESGLIWKTGSMLNKTEIWIEKDKIK